MAARSTNVLWNARCTRMDVIVNCPSRRVVRANATYMCVSNSCHSPSAFAIDSAPCAYWLQAMQFLGMLGRVSRLLRKDVAIWLLQQQSSARQTRNQKGKQAQEFAAPTYSLSRWI